VPILANGVRAWGTVFAAQHVGAEKAAGIDHLIYGWIFFAVVIAAVLAMSWRFFDRGPNDRMIDAQAIAQTNWVTRFEGKPFTNHLGLLGMAGLAGLALGWSAYAQSLQAPLPGQIFLPEVAGWQRADFAPTAKWEPRAKGAEHRLLGSYTDGQGRRVDVFFAQYASQAEGKEAGGFGEGALRPESGWAWTSSGPAIGGAKSERLVYEGTTERLALTWYRTGDLLTGSNTRLKLANIADRLLLRARPTAMLIFSAEAAPGNDPAAALAAFHRAAGEIGPWMDRIGQGG